MIHCDWDQRLPPQKSSAFQAPYLIGSSFCHLLLGLVLLHLSYEIFRATLSQSASPVNPTHLNPTPATCHKRKRKLLCNFRNAALQKLHCNFSIFCSAEVILTKSCAAASENLQCNIEKAALQESGAFLPLSCGFQAPRLRHPRLGPAESIVF